MFQHEMKENKEKKINIEDLEPDVLKELLRFLYCGHSNNINELCSELFIAAEKYQLDVLKTQCEIILWRNITSENALAMYMLADTHNGSLLKEKAVKMMKK
jgi:speckle-type POZ protein